MKLGSLFDGSGGFPLAGVLCGMEPVWASEIEKYPLKVTAARFPRMLQLGDVTKIKGSDIEPVDVITFGSPCQDLSVAGKQKGIHAGERSNLFFEAIRIIHEMREATNHEYPRYAVWENVPGAFSSNHGGDFRAVLQALCSEAEAGVHVPMSQNGKWKHAGCIVGDGWSVAWRLYDAQFWGVPQRRKRIYLVADFGSESAGEILFERESVRRDLTQSREAWEGTAEDAQGGAGGSGITGGVAAFMGGQGAAARGIGYDERIAPTLKSVASGSNQVPDVVYALEGNTVDRNSRKNGRGWSEGVSPTLNTQDRHAVCYSHNGNHCGNYEESGVGATLQTRYHYGSGGDSAIVVFRKSTKARTAEDAETHLKDDVSNTLTKFDVGESRANELIVYSSSSHGTLSEGVGTVGTGTRAVHEMVAVYPAVTGALCANSHPGSYTGQDAFNDMLPVIKSDKPPRKYIVRRLTPLECCRLQGFPDWWTEGAEGSDSAKYKMWGNGIALPCAVDVLARLKGGDDENS